MVAAAEAAAEAAVEAASFDGAGGNMCTERKLIAHLEEVLFGAARGDVPKTHLLLLQLLDRPRVQHLFKTYGSEVHKTQRAV